MASDAVVRFRVVGNGNYVAPVVDSTFTPEQARTAADLIAKQLEQCCGEGSESESCQHSKLRVYCDSQTGSMKAACITCAAPIPLLDVVATCTNPLVVDESPQSERTRIADTVAAALASDEAKAIAYLYLANLGWNRDRAKQVYGTKGWEV